MQKRSRARSVFVVSSLVAAAVAVLVLALPRPARAFGDVGAFDPRVLLVGGVTGAARASAPARWSWELVQRTSAPGWLKLT